MTFEELKTKFATKTTDSACAARDSEGRDAISVFHGTTTIPTVCRATAQPLVASKTSAIQLASVLAFQTLPASNARRAQRDTINSPSVCPATVTRTVLERCLVTARVSASANTISMAKRAASAKRDSTISRRARNATVTRLA